ncbi:hypothetical protein NUU61_001807 [Penicillium alfredii]|uniref:COP9 signalosome complex subunit 6 n=1 Tax=Penicillium alfredii TaxID=1506179 RepID=A0A9W9KFE6_9EURO|nr:uncharacterized protein NUU61_001807 [Penicillium alfredii]KAJ5104460.1 hypothetical protein NUU61_001807 [Penicillium alfredii]
MMDPLQSLVSQRSSDSGLHIQLHPLVLLTVSDHITRHAARQQQGPIIGALLGQQNGREITVEHAFECHITGGPNGEVLLLAAWFEERVKQQTTVKDVHKDPPLDLVGWWSTAPSTGPDSSHLPLHRQLLQDYNESSIFLAFHPSQVQSSSGAKLPLTIYESVHEGENAADTAKEMQVDGEETRLNIRFRELPYSVETGEAEMIGLDTIAKSSGNASESQVQESTRQAGQKTSTQAELPHQEEELIGNLNTRLNAIRTLESRISLIKSYLSSISSDTESEKDSTTKDVPTALSHPILRNINSLLSHLSILSPPEQSAFATEVLSQNNDVLMASLLGQLGKNAKALRDLGRKSALVSSARSNVPSRRNPALAQSRFEDQLLAQGIGSGRGGGAMY